MRNAWKIVEQIQLAAEGQHSGISKKKKRDTLKVLIMNNYMPLVLF